MREGTRLANMASVSFTDMAFYSSCLLTVSPVALCAQSPSLSLILSISALQLAFSINARHLLISCSCSGITFHVFFRTKKEEKEIKDEFAGAGLVVIASVSGMEIQAIIGTGLL